VDVSPEISKETIASILRFAHAIKHSSHAQNYVRLAA
jgi:hypothetical protein